MPRTIAIKTRRLGNELKGSFLASPQAPWLASLTVPLIAAPVWFALFRNSGHTLPLQTFAGLVLLFVAGVIAYTDFLSYRIPNWATYPAFAWGLAINLLASSSYGQAYSESLGAVGLAQSLLGAAVLFVVMLIIFSYTGGGAGDVKLVAAIGALLGLGRGIDAVTYAMALAGISMIIVAVYKHGPLRLLDSAIRPIAWRLFPVWIDAPSAEHYRLMKSSVPLGPFFAAGIILVLIDAGPNLQSFASY